MPIEIIHYSINGTRDLLEAIMRTSGVRGEVVDYPACATLFADVQTGSPEYRSFEENIARHGLRASKIPYYFPTDEELQQAPLFKLHGCSWTDDINEIVAEPAYSGRDACPECGKGTVELTAPLRVHTGKLRGAHLVRVPPGLFLASKKLVELMEQERWTGIETRLILERRDGAPTEAFRQLIITSMLPAMHASGQPVRRTIPKYCEKCRRLGYQLPGPQVVYPSEILENTADFNLSREWTAAHFVSCPCVICTRRVVHELLKLEPDQVWLPVKLAE